MLSLLSVADLDREAIEGLLDSASAYRAGSLRSHEEALVCLCFLESSLRTRVGFDAAASRLRARTCTIEAERQGGAMWGQETLSDAIRSVGAWFDVICLRHPDPAEMQAAARVSAAPVVNCGDGTREHPTQALIDALALTDAFGAIDGLSIALVGDLRGMRTAHSLVSLLARFDAVSVRCVSPPGLELPDAYRAALLQAGHAVEETDRLALDDLDAVYVAGLPADTEAGILSRELQRRYTITADVVRTLAPRTRVLCPLPRVDEISSEVDSMPAAAYFAQARAGLWMRMAVLDAVLS